MTAETSDTRSKRQLLQFWFQSQGTWKKGESTVNGEENKAGLLTKKKKSSEVVAGKEGREADLTDAVQR